MRTIFGVMAAAMVACSAGAAEQVRFYNTDGNNNEDGFVADLKSNGYDNPTGDFVTFCVEVVETFSYGTEYDFGISDEVRHNAGNGNTPLDSAAGRRVAWLYRTFTTGGEAALRALAGAGNADFSGFNDQQVRVLFQRYIWDRFAYPDSDNWSNATYKEEMFDRLTSQADAGGAQSGLHNVRVMNVYKKGSFGDPNNGQQDMLIVIPLPSAAGLASLGVLGLVAFGRRRMA